MPSELSKTLDILDENELNLLNGVLLRVGKLPDTKNISLKEVSEAFAFDKKTVGKSLQWILLRKIGEPVIIENRDIKASIIQETLRKVLHE